jgi:hypothetical protein
MFAAGDDRNLELLTQGLAPRHLASIYGVSPYYPANPSISGEACSGLNPHTGSYYLSAITSQERLIEKTILQPKTPDRDSAEDYPEIGDSAY